MAEFSDKERMAAGAPIASGLCFAAYGMQVRAQRNLHLGSNNPLGLEPSPPSRRWGRQLTAAHARCCIFAALKSAFMSPEMIHPSQRILLVSGNKSNKKQIKNSNLLIETPGGMHCGAPLRERAAVRTRKISSLQPASGPFPLPLERIPGPQKHLYR